MRDGNIAPLHCVYSSVGGVIIGMSKKFGFTLRIVALALALVSGERMFAALEPSVLNCASVDQAGLVTLTWSSPADPGGEFGNYQIHRSASLAGPYVTLPPILTYATNVWLDPTSNADIGPVFYYITTFTNGSTPEESLPSDTVSTIFLQVFQSTPPGSADLSWNALAVAPTADDTFSVWLEYPIGTLQLLEEVTSTTFSYQHVVSVCEDSLTFHVRREDSRGCTSVSNWDGDVFRDVTPPSSPIITSVTVDTLTGLATLDWEPSPEADTDGYIIVFDALGGAVIIDTIFGQNNTTYEWADSEAGLGSESYAVAAFDTCEVGVPPSPNTSPTRPMHSTVFVGLLYDECASTVQLSWSQYVGWPVLTYEVYVQQNGGPWVLLIALDGATTSYLVSTEPFQQYCFAIKALRVDLPGSSLSNSTCITTDYPGLPAFNYMRSVTVSGENEITITDSVDVAAIVNGYILERSVNGGAFEAIDFRIAGAASVLVFVDADVEPATTSYQYRVVVLDGCGAASVVSNIGANIVLRVRAELSGLDILEWNGYEDWAGNVQFHTIQRSIETLPFSLIAILPPDPWYHADDVSNLTGTTGRFCYFVEALEAGNPSGINAVSRSNIACAVQEETVYIPNAFVIGGYNPVFKPSMAYVDVSEYELSIINRWGQVFWTTNDPTEAWDGTASGQPVPTGLYGYYCKFKNGDGRTFEKRGTVTMLTATD